MVHGYRILRLHRLQTGRRRGLWYGDRAHRLIQCIRAVLHQHRARVEQRGGSLGVGSHLRGRSGHSHSAGSHGYAMSVVSSDDHVVAERRHWCHGRIAEGTGCLRCGTRLDYHIPIRATSWLLINLRVAQPGHALVKSSHRSGGHIQPGHTPVRVAGGMQATRAPGIPQFHPPRVARMLGSGRGSGHGRGGGNGR